MWKFLQSEMKVILGLTEDASRTDAEIADIYDLKKGTVSSVRRRLLDAGAIHYSYVPSFNRLGCEMIGFHCGSSDPAIRSDTKANHYMDFCNRTPQVFFALIGGSSVVMYTALRNATEYETFIQHHNSFFTGTRKASKSKLTSVIFPFNLSRGTYVPQFASLVHNYFQMDVPAPKVQSAKMAKVDPVDLTKIEKSTLVNMVANPSASDREIASTVKLSRQAVTRIRNKFKDEAILKKICIPRLYRWGFEICVVAHPKFNVEVPWDKRMRNEPRQASEMAFYLLSKADEAVANYMISKFTKYSEQLEDTLALYHKSKVLDDKPEILLFSLERSTELRTFDYSQAVRHILTPDSRPSDPIHRENI
jgi:DNA-binding Lrp family transcriptional regulator